MPIPPLPRELHHEIIEWCCSRYQYKRPGYAFESAPYDPEYRRIRTLCLVNKDWLAYAQPILYSAISSSAGPGLLSRLQRNPALPLLVKSLFLPTFSPYMSSPTHLGVDFPHLLVLGDLDLFDETSWLGFTRIVSHSPRLRKLLLDLAVFSGAASSPSISFSALKMLEVSTVRWKEESSNVLDYLLGLDADHFPHGLEVFHCYFQNGGVDIAIVRRFLDRIGPSLLHLDLHGIEAEDVDELLDQCPLLQSFGASTALDAEALASEWILSTGHPTLSTLRLPGPKSHDSHYDPAGLVRCVAEAKLPSSSSSNHPSSLAFPSLATVHIVDTRFRSWLEILDQPHYLRGLTNNDCLVRWRSLVDVCEELGLALEDDTGETCSDWTATLSELDAAASRIEK